ncbi:hypothetical protein ACFQ0F_01325 [Paraperlucidibaca wandonensis]|uniref:Uncharacterized protein n=1 Tax=Paraperlucidibaca wandonensis TaxID=1268273 RepID=A0ABW3HCV8_9GAMM
MKPFTRTALLPILLTLAACSSEEKEKTPITSASEQALLPAAFESDGETAFENTGDNCRNFMVIAPVLEENARKFVPKEFTLVQPPLAFVEMAECEGGSINGVDSGPFAIGEAAVFITPPDGSAVPPVIGNQAIYLLWQLDTNAELARLKRNAGFFGEVVSGIELNISENQLLPGLPSITKFGTAKIPYKLSPYEFTATLTPESPEIPPLINDLWHAGSKGTVHTHNGVFVTTKVMVGMGSVTVKKDTVLHELFGSTAVTGFAISGLGSFVNTTELRPDIASTKPDTAP